MSGSGGTSSIVTASTGVGRYTAVACTTFQREPWRSGAHTAPSAAGPRGHYVIGNDHVSTNSGERAIALGALPPIETPARLYEILVLDTFILLS